MTKNTIICCLLFMWLYGYGQDLSGSFESKFKRYEKNEDFSGVPTQNWTTVAWKGERINKQIVLWSSSTVNNLTYSLSDLVSDSDRIASSNISLLFGKHIKGDPKARSCAEYPTRTTYVEIIDALSDEYVTSIFPSEPLKLWLKIDVPRETVPGNYTGSLTINGGSSSLKFNISLNVIDYTLPNVSNWKFHLDLWQFPLTVLDQHNYANSNNKISPWSDKHFELLKPFYILLASAGQKAITTYIKGGALGANSMVKWSKKANGSWEYDFSVFDKYVTNLMSWGITKQISCFSPVGWNESVIPYWDEATNSLKNLSASLGSSTYNARWDHFLTQFKIYLDSKGWFDKVVLYLDEVSETKLNSVVSVVHGNNSKWKLGIAYSHGLSTTSKGNFYDLSGILESASNEGIDPEKVSTFYTSCTQKKPNNYVTPENSPAEMTWMGWHAFKGGYDGYLRWAYDNWKWSDPFDARDGAHTAGDFSMIYRNSNMFPFKVLSSIRFELLREGIQDFEKLSMLKSMLMVSSDPKDKEFLNQLNATVDNFDKTSGTNAQQLIVDAQQVIENISLATLHIEDIQNLSDFILYPNPTKNKIAIEIPLINNQKAEIKIFNSVGQIIYGKKWDPFQSPEAITLPVALKSGTYYARVESQVRTFNSKVMRIN